MNRLSRSALSVLALLTLLVLVVGIPVGLAVAVGWPFPDPWPSPTELGDMLAGRAPVPADLVISVLALVMWLLWFQVAWAVAVEVLAAARGRLASRAPVLPGLQLTVGKLVTAATLLTSSLSARPVSAGPLPEVAPVTQGDEVILAQNPSEASNGASASRSSGPAVRAYLTEPGDTWWGIAEDVYGSGPRWKEIRNLNLGRTMDDGSVISVATDLLRPQWRLLLPAGADTPAATAATGPTLGQSMERPEVLVESGDTVWGLAEDDLESLGRDASNVAVAERVGEITEINRDRLNGDPDLIYPGQRLELPARPILAERAPAAVPESTEAADDPGPPPDDGEADDDGADAADAGGDPTDGADADGAPPAEADIAADEPDDDVDRDREESASERVELESVPEQPATDQPEADEPPAMSEASDPGRTTARAEAPPDTAPSDPATTSDATTATTDSVESTGAGPAGEVVGDTDPLEASAAPASTEDAPTDDPAGPAPTDAGATATGTDAPADESDASPLSPAGEITFADDGSAVPSLAGARASSPDWIPSSTPDADTTVGLDTGEETSVPASAARSLIDPEADAPTTTREPTAELPALAPADAIDVVVNGSPGADEGLDTADNRAPVFAGLAALTLLGGYLFKAKRRRRKTVLQNRHPGRRPEPSKRRTRTLTRRLAAAAEPGHPDFVNLGLRALGRLLNDLPAAELPRISGVWVSQNRLVLALSDDTPNRPPPAPFTPFADGSGWSLSRSHFDEIRAIARGANGPLPLLATVGTTTALDLALTTNSRAPAEAYGLTSSLLFAVDLEAGRVISVEGRPTDVIETLTMMAVELATSETADQAEIICVGFGHRLATFDRVMVVDDLSEIMTELAEVTSRAVHAAGDASPFATRVRDGAVDTWNPVIVFHADPDDPEAEELVDLAERTDGGVTLVCGYPADSGWRFLVDGDGVNCPDLPGSLAGHRFSRPRPGEADDLIDLFEEDHAGEIDLDDEFWRPLGDEEFGLQPGPTRVSAGAWSSDGPDAVDTGAGEATTEMGPAWQPLPAVTVPDRPGGPVGPSPDGELPALTLRHSVEHRGDEVPPPGPPPTPAKAEAGPDQATTERAGTGDPAATEPPVTAGHSAAAEPETEGSVAEPRDATGAPLSIPEVDDTPAPGPGGRHLYVVGETERPTDPLDRPDDAEPTGAGPEAPDPVAAPDATAANEPAPPEAEPALRVNVLGNFTIGGFHVGDRAKPWKYTKTAELVLYLLLHPGGASQDLLMEQLFPEQPTNRPRLNQLVSDARTKALGVDHEGEYHLPHASPSDPFYRLTTSVAFDLRDFALHCARARRAETKQEQARDWQAALELVTGRPFTLPHDGYGWAIPEIEATIVKVEEAAVALADIAMDLGDHRLAVWATKKGLLTGTGYYELLVRRGRAALLLEDPEEIVRAFADLQVSLDHTGAPEEGMPDLGGHPDLADVYNDLSDGGRGGRDRNP